MISYWILIAAGVVIASMIVEFFLRSRHDSSQQGHHAPKSSLERGDRTKRSDLWKLIRRMVLFASAAWFAWLVVESGTIRGVSYLGGQQRELLDSSLIIRIGVSLPPSDIFNGYQDSGTFASNTPQIMLYFYYKSSAGGPGHVRWTKPDGVVTNVPLFFVNGMNEAILPRPADGYPTGQHSLLLIEGPRALAELSFLVVDSGGN